MSDNDWQSSVGCAGSSTARSDEALLVAQQHSKSSHALCSHPTDCTSAGSCLLHQLTQDAAGCAAASTQPHLLLRHFCSITCDMCGHCCRLRLSLQGCWCDHRVPRSCGTPCRGGSTKVPVWPTGEGLAMGAVAWAPWNECAGST